MDNKTEEKIATAQINLNIDRSQKSTAENERNPDELPVLELTADDYRNLARAIEDSEYSQKVLGQHKQDYERFVKEHGIEVREHEAGY